MDGSSVAKRTTGGLALGYGVIHACVDFATVTAVFRAGRLLHAGVLTPFALVVSYDILAFALQCPLGAVVDRFRATRGAVGLGLLFTLASVLLVPVSGVATMLAAGIGNALYHLGAGARVLEAAEGRSAPAGFFVAPGALGLGLGIWFGRQGTLPAWPLALLIGLCWPVAWKLSAHAPGGEAPHSRVQVRRHEASSAVWPIILSLVLLSVMVRSFVGFAGDYQCPKTTLLAWGLPLAGFSGKLLGGMISDRLGWLETTVGALLLSAPFIAWNGGSVYLVLPALLVFQTTMPVTLTAVYLLFPEKPAMAFGLPSLALVLGALPTFYPLGRPLYQDRVLFGLVLLSGLAVLGALHRLGIRLRYRATGA
jgi:FSR family fosmidomycin resistance protein-like MFS transporter